MVQKQKGRKFHSFLHSYITRVKVMTNDVIYTQVYYIILTLRTYIFLQQHRAYAHGLGATVISAHFHSESQLQTNMNYVAWWRGEL